jgi:integrase
MAVSWAKRQADKGVKLELTPFLPRNCWKKYKGKVYYLNHPLTNAGYKAALLEWVSILAELDRERPHAKTYHHHREQFLSVQRWYEQFGVPDGETKLAKHVDDFLSWLNDRFQQPTLQPLMPFMSFTTTRTRKDFWHDFIENGTGYTLFGDQQYMLPQKWQERLRQLEERGGRKKKPQVIGHWLDEYLKRTDARTHHSIRLSTGLDRDFKLRSFKRWIDQSKHVTTLDETTVSEFHEHLATTAYAKSTKEGYFKAFRMFVRWAAKQPDCELAVPQNLDDREFLFREPKGTGRKREEKKKQLWTPDEFALVLEKVPQPYRCYLVLMLNCGFRNIDLSSLQKSDLRLKTKRILYQREKTNQNDTSPVVSYPLWDATVELIKEAISDDDTFCFLNSAGGRLVVSKRTDGEKIVYDTVSRYWRRYRKKFGLAGKRLDFIRKTGSTRIKPEFQQARVFTEGLAAVQRPDEQWGYIDKTGKTVIGPKFDSANTFKDGKASVTLDGNEKMIDRTGRIVR